MARALYRLLFDSCKRASFYRLCDRVCPDPHLRRPFHTICSLMRKCGARSYLVETHVELSPQYEASYNSARAEIADLKACWSGSNVSLTQVSFFRCNVRNRAKKLPDRVEDNDVLATVLIATLTRRRSKTRARQRRSYVLEAIVTRPTVCCQPVGQKRRVVSRLLNNYYHIGDKIDVVIAAKRFTMEAAYFCQQSGVNSLCGHAALKMALWHLDGFTPPTTGLLNEAARRARSDLPPELRIKKDPSEKFCVADIHGVCQQFGIKTISIDCEADPVPPYEAVYQLVESGIPTVLVFASVHDKSGEILHVVPVIGHTMNSDEWFPRALGCYRNLSRVGLRSSNADCLCSVEWAPHLIIHDDLLGPYMCMDATSFPTAKLAKDSRDSAAKGSLTGRHFKHGAIRYIIGFLTPGLAIDDSPTFVQEVAASYIHGVLKETVQYVKGPWRQRLQSLKLDRNSLVLRTQIVERGDYVRGLLAMRDHEGHSSLITRSDRDSLATLPDTMWMIEFSLVDLYCANRTKLGELLLPLQLPDELVDVLRTGDAEVVPMFRLINYAEIRGEKVLDFGFRSHTPLHRRQRRGFEF